MARTNAKYLIHLYKYQFFPINDWNGLDQPTNIAIAPNSTDKWT